MSVTFITGGANGIGAATVRYFIGQGAQVAFVDNDLEAGKALAAAYTPEQLCFIPADVRNRSQLDEAIQVTLSTFGDLSAVIANAGVFHSGNLMETSKAIWQEILDVNLTGVLHTLQASLPHLIKRGGGHMVLLGSDQSFIAKRRSLAYAASKGAIAQMTKAIALDYAGQGIFCNAVCPGTTRTPMTETIVHEWAQREFDGDTHKVWHKILNEYPVGRVGRPEEIARLIYFLASEGNSFITGSLLPIDGGETAR